jgi:hypothetical protein
MDDCWADQHSYGVGGVARFGIPILHQDTNILVAHVVGFRA